MLGWTRTKVANYKALEDIHKDAWETVVTTFQKVVTTEDENVVTQNVTTVTFSERLLRNILDLTPDQQQELVTKLAKNNKYKKADFRKDAEKYKIRNQISSYITGEMPDYPEEYINQCITDSENGMYAREWKKNSTVKLDSLIQSYIDAWEKKHSSHVPRGNAG